MRSGSLLRPWVWVCDRGRDAGVPWRVGTAGTGVAVAVVVGGGVGGGGWCWWWWW